MKTRVFPESNYKAIYINGKTLRIPLDPGKPITRLAFPEFYDVKITNKCNGNCPYCYQDSTEDSGHFSDIPQKLQDFFGVMSENERPFQVAIGGGEPTLHPEFDDICRTFKELGIDPNYTTNGTHLTDEVLETTREYVNGVAVSCHGHLPWGAGVDQLLSANVYTNLHLIISDKASVDQFVFIHENFTGDIKHFVLLPLINHGRADGEFECWDYLEEKLDNLDNIADVAFGALFHPYIQDAAKRWNISLYEPESMSKYLVMDDMSLHPSSFDVS